MESLNVYLAPADIIHWDDIVVRQAAEIVGGLTDPSDQARNLFTWVRDEVKYNPYSPFFLPEHYWPRTTLKRGEGYCVQKAALLVALLRCQGIPARLIHADIINHRFSQKLVDYMGSNLFVYHAYVDIFLNGKWIKATPSFEKELCRDLGIYPVEFSGREDAILHPLDKEGRPHIEYVRHHGVYADVQLDEIMAAWERTYTKERVESWKAVFLSDMPEPARKFS